jgi:hypothetical protein
VLELTVVRLEGVRRIEDGLWQRGEVERLDVRPEAQAERLECLLVRARVVPKLGLERVVRRLEQ